MDAGNPGTMPSREMIVNELKTKVRHRAYEIDCNAVAEAFLARQTRCWYPASLRGPDASASTSPAGPSTTRPNTDSPGRPAGPQAHSS